MVDWLKLEWKNNNWRIWSEITCEPQLPESKENTTQQQQVIAATHKFQYFTCKTMTTIQDCESYSWTVSLCDVGPLLQGQFILKLQCVVGLVHLYCHEFESQSAKCLCANDPFKVKRANSQWMPWNVPIHCGFNLMLHNCMLLFFFNTKHFFINTPTIYVTVLDSDDLKDAWEFHYLTKTPKLTIRSSSNSQKLNISEKYISPKKWRQSFTYRRYMFTP